MSERLPGYDSWKLRSNDMSHMEEVMDEMQGQIDEMQEEIKRLRVIETAAIEVRALLGKLDYEDSHTINAHNLLDDALTA